jgi:hypothetical protein
MDDFGSSRGNGTPNPRAGLEPASDIHARVLEEWQRFRAALPALLGRYGGRWVVFLYGRVEGDFDDIDAAYVAALERFGPEGGFVVSRVEHKHPLLAYGFGRAGAVAA